MIEEEEHETKQAEISYISPAYRSKKQVFGESWSWTIILLSFKTELSICQNYFDKKGFTRYISLVLLYK